MLFNIKAGCWVLKSTTSRPTKCKFCEGNDGEIHRIFKCSTLNEQRDELVISAMVYDLWLHKNS